MNTGTAAREDLPPNAPEFEAMDWDAWRPDLEATLLYVLRGGRLLLIEKKRGLGAGKLNGAGGKVDPGETVDRAAVREFEEELVATPLDPVRLGRVAFAVTRGPSILIHVYRADALEGEPAETEEAAPVWAPVDDLPYDRMWADDRYWLPFLLNGEPFEARALFDGDRMLGFELVSP